VTDSAAPATVATNPEEHGKARMMVIRRLEKLLVDERNFSVRATRQLHRAMNKDLKAARRRTAESEEQVRRLRKELRAARARARRAEAELEALKNSRTWKAGRALTAVPGKLKNLGR